MNAETKPNTRLECPVCHGSGYLGEIDGWFHRRMRQFVLHHSQEYPTSYLPAMAEQEIGGFGDRWGAP
jgi:hypothetical protein